MGRELDLDFALELADLADSISRPRFRAPDLAVDTKPDLTPVTDADKAVERALRERIAARRPGETVLGEEEGGAGDAPVRWILDPIDGTKNYARGIPVWGTLIALEEAGTPRIGVVSAPALGRRLRAERGEGAFAGHERLRVSEVERIEDAVLSFALDREPPGLAWRAWHLRAIGDFWAHMLVAEGAVDAAVDAVGVAAWDLAAVRVIVEEAGGRFSDFTGSSRIDGGTGLTSNGRLHDELLAALAEDRLGSG
jgi:histidinol-phosphatase